MPTFDAIAAFTYCVLLCVSPHVTVLLLIPVVIACRHNFVPSLELRAPPPGAPPRGGAAPRRVALPDWIAYLL